MRTSLFLLLTSLLFSCEQNDNFPKATTSGGSSTTTTLPSNLVPFAPANWRSYVGDVGNVSNPNNYRHTLVTDGSSSSPSSPMSGSGLVGLSSRPTSYTLGMAASTITDTASYCYWAYSFYPPTTLRVGRSLTLKAKVKLDNVQGRGVSLVLRGDRNSQPVVLFATTEGKLPLRGSVGLTEYSVTMPYSTSVDYLLVYFMMLSNTTGTATFTDVSVEIQ